MPLKQSFFARDTLLAARDLLGKKLVRTLNGQQLSGLIVETEAYLSEADSANHAAKGRTPRNSVMFEAGGIAYVYFVYGMHYMLNVVTGVAGKPCAVLLRAIQPLEGVETMRALRGNKTQHLTDGPARLCQALNIDKSFNRWDLTQGSRLWIEDAPPPPAAQIMTGPRIGIGYASPQAKQAPWRFWLKNNPYVSITAGRKSK